MHHSFSLFADEEVAVAHGDAAAGGSAAVHGDGGDDFAIGEGLHHGGGGRHFSRDARHGARAYFTEKRWTVVLRKVWPGRRMVLGKSGWLGESG